MPLNAPLGNLLNDLDVLFPRVFDGERKDQNSMVKSLVKSSYVSNYASYWNSKKE